MDEMANPTGPRKELINSHCLEFMQLIKVRLFLNMNFISVIVYNVKFLCWETFGNFKCFFGDFVYYAGNLIG